jgi:hypothetical protein
MSDQTVKQDDLAKALNALQDLAKGHSSRGTNTTDVETMRDAGAAAGSDAGSTQVFHTAANSEPSSWAGSVKQGCGDDGASDSISENGTDYQAQAKMMKSILAKLSKGQALTASEYNMVKGMANFEKKEDKEDKEEEVEKAKACDKDDEEMGKSLSDFANENEVVSRGLEVSEFLASFASVVEKSLSTLEERVVARVASELGSTHAESGEFQKSLAGALAGLGETMAAVVQRIDQVENQAARPPKSVQGVHAIEKGGYAGPEAGESLNKALVGEALVQLVQNGKAQVTDVIKFESTGQITPALDTAVRGLLGSGR